jgi:hypothetical protein
METIGKNIENAKLTQSDLVLAAYSLAQLHNAYLNSLESKDYTEEMTEEQMHLSIQSIHAAHTKFNALIEILQMDTQQDEEGEE